jgi:carboxyl-terminal processing protease
MAFCSRPSSSGANQRVVCDVMRTRFVLLTALLSAVCLDAVPAQSTDADAQSAFALVRECVDKIFTSAYRVESKPSILSKALHELVRELGDSAAKHDTDLSALSDEAAQTAFEKSLLNLAAMPGQRHNIRELAESALQGWCRQHDPYTRYIRSEDFKLVMLMSKSSGSSVGMTVNEKGGNFLCFPLPGSPAEAAGIKAGDRLISVDGKPLAGRHLEYIASLIKGAPGTEVQLRVGRNFGRDQTVKIVREILTAPSVIVEKKITGTVVRIRKFSSDLMVEARKAFADLSAGSNITLDLRGCPGGNLDVAIEFASLFLSDGEPIVTLRTRGKPDEVRNAQNLREVRPPAILLLQDEGTASAAELVIAALINSKNNRAASQGTKTYGKGVFQNTYDLQGGGHLIITTGETIAPGNQSWDGIGLLPSLENGGLIFAK